MVEFLVVVVGMAMYVPNLVLGQLMICSAIFYRYDAKCPAGKCCVLRP